MRSYSVRFRHGLNPSVRSKKRLDAEHSFANDQTWVETNHTLSFVDETPDVLTSGNDGSDKDDNDEGGGLEKTRSTPSLSNPVELTEPPPSLNSHTASEPVRPPSPTLTPARDDGHSRKRRTLSTASLRTPEAFSTSPNSAGSQIGDQRLGLHDQTSFSTHSETSFTRPEVEASVYTPSNNAAESIPGIYLEVPRWPMQDRQEAMLLRYFVDSLAPLFDMCDKDRHFARVVPVRAAQCPPLMNAVLAASAKRLSRITSFDCLMADRYQQSCLDALIPALSNSAAVMDENLLAAIVILRFMEELDVPISSHTSESHLMGTRVFIAAQGRMGDYAGLRLAGFWLALRQEIYMAFIQARPVHHNFALDDVARFIRPDDQGCSFANMTIIRCAACIRYCYGAEEQSVEAWEALRESQDRWWAGRPWAFYPMYSDAGAGGEGFLPEELYLDDAVVTGVQHHYLARILMEAHNPKVPRLGPGRAMAFKEADDEIKRMVRIICGIAEVTFSMPSKDSLVLYY